MYALGKISSDSHPIAENVPVHVLTSSRPDARLELHIGDPGTPITGLPDGHLRAIWTDYSGGATKTAKYARYALGTPVLLALIAFALTMAHTPQKGSNR